MKYLKTFLFVNNASTIFITSRGQSICLMMADKEDMEDGEISDDSTDEGPLYQYTPLERPAADPAAAKHSSKTAQDDEDEYDSDHAPPDLQEDSGSDSDSEFNKPKAKQSRSGLWARRDALVVEDGGGETFKKMAQAFQMQRDAQGLNKRKKRNNVWGSFIQEESLNAEITDSLGVGRSLKDLGSDRGAETYDFTLIAKERREEERKKKLEEKQNKGSKLDDDMDSYWSKKDDAFDDDNDDDVKNDIKDDAMEACVDDNDDEIKDKRGVKRSVKDRLGDRKVKLDCFKNEVLPPPGKPRQIPDIAEDSLVEGTDEDFGKELAERLQEEKVDMIIDLLKILGRRVVWDFFKQTQDIESKGGMMINNGARRRTAGGVMMHLLRITEDQEISEKAKIFFRESQKNDNKRRVLQAKSKKKKKFEDEMEDFLRRKREMAQNKNKEDEMDEGTEKAEEEELKPLPNILSMIAENLDAKAPKEASNASVGRSTSFKEPDAPPNSVERVERNLIGYDDDDFLTSSNDTEDIELF